MLDTIHLDQEIIFGGIQKGCVSERRHHPSPTRRSERPVKKHSSRKSRLVRVEIRDVDLAVGREASERLAWRGHCWADPDGSKQFRH